jgi:uncharacterized protein (TIGR03086 family)
MTDTLAALRRAQDGFTAALDAAGGKWDASTPCAEWNVRELVNHVVGEFLWAPPLVEGKTIEEVGDAFDGDVLGDDPVATWRKAVDGSRAAFGADGALERTVHLSFGDFSGNDYCWQLISDVLVHTWDLARGVGADDALPGDLSDDVYAVLDPMLNAFGPNDFFAAPREVGSDASPQERLLARTGRKP